MFIELFKIEGDHHDIFKEKRSGPLGMLCLIVYVRRPFFCLRRY